MKKKKGFTLIELSIVLVIIGLIVGGVLVGQDLIESARLRAQVSQIENYRTAVYTFKAKYNCLPGDCRNAAAFGFSPRGVGVPQGNGDRIIQGSNKGNQALNRPVIDAGEAALFWRDLSEAELITETFNTGLCCSSALPGAISTTSTPAIKDYIPEAKIGDNHFLYVYTEYIYPGFSIPVTGINYFSLVRIEETNSTGAVAATNPLGLKVSSAYAIDSKIDEGKPQAGKVTARFYAGTSIAWAHGDTANSVYGTADTSATAGNDLTCFDNNNSAGAEQAYSLSQNNGDGKNCALQFVAGF